MDRLIYTALSGLVARSREQAVTANNLANAGTTGFRRELVAAEGRYVGNAGVSRVQAGAPSVTTAREAGRVTATGRPLDIAMAGDAWLAVQGKTPGTQAYSRRGDLSVNAAGVLETGDGRAVLGQSGTPITLPAGAEITIAPDGGIGARVGDTITQVDKLRLVAGVGLQKGLDGLFQAPAPLPPDATARITTGALEASNVESTSALTELVAQSRAFEMGTRLLGVAKDIDERTARLMAMEAQ